MASNPQERLYNNDNNRKDIPEYMKKTDSLNIFDNKYSLLREENKNINNFNKKFNKKYLINRNKRFNKLKKKEKRRLKKLNEIKYRKKLHEYTIGEFLFSFKDNIFFVINALLNKNYDIKTYTENYRLLHIGLLIIFLCIILLILKIDPYKNNINLK